MNRFEFEKRYMTEVMNYANYHHKDHPLWDYNDFLDYCFNNQEWFEEYVTEKADARVKDELERPDFYGNPVVGEEW